MVTAHDLVAQIRTTRPDAALTQMPIEYHIAVVLAAYHGMPDPHAVAEQHVARLQGQVPCAGDHELLDILLVDEPGRRWPVAPPCPSCGAAL